MVEIVLVNSLFPVFISYDNLKNAFFKSYKVAKNSKHAQLFFFNLEKELLFLKLQLQSFSYYPGEYVYFKIKDPKERNIAVAPFRDRVVHHAIVNVLEPIYERCFYYHSYATRKNKGTHKAILKAQEYLRKNYFYFKSDIKRYFYSVDNSILQNIICKKIEDKRFLEILRRIFENGSCNGKGLPIGNLTSQFFANVYLDVFDRFVKNRLGMKFYIRYMDDFVIFSNDKTHLKSIRKQISDFLLNTLCLELKEEATYINTQMNGLSFLGARIFPGTLRIIKENFKRSFKKYKQKEFDYNNGKIDDLSFVNSLNSIFAHMRFFDTYKLRRSFMVEDLKFIQPCDLWW